MYQDHSNHLIGKQLSSDEEMERVDSDIDVRRNRFPFCIVWTPIPGLTWLFPFLGHMGICTSTGIITDFAGPYYVSENNMAFGDPVKYVRLEASRAQGGAEGWDRGVQEAGEIYKNRMHNLCCDNCHSHVATALNLMHYNGCRTWNMVSVAILLYRKCTYVSWMGLLKTYLPFLIVCSIAILLATFI